MFQDFRVSIFDMVMCLSNALDLINHNIVDHHKRVAYIAYSIAVEMGLSIEEQNNILLAGLLHDCGAFYLSERLNSMKFEIENPYRHAEIGYLLLKNFKPFSRIAALIRNHHALWKQEKNILPGSYILHLADRVSVLINKQQDVLGMAKEITQKIENLSGENFSPEVVKAFRNLSLKEFFWLDSASPSINLILSRISLANTIELNIENLITLAKLFCQIIDFRSHFTATHSSGIAASAEAIARVSGFSEKECQMMKVAGYLHDLGKLAVPTEILEKPEKLTNEEYNVIRSHTYYTYKTIETIKEFNIINMWASFHHERLDGNGYPFHLREKEIPLGSKIMAVADVFTALAEDRPYRNGMETDKVLKILENMGNNLALDINIISTLKKHYDEINNSRTYAQKEAKEIYKMVKIK